MESGIVYIFVNEAMPGYIKIGLTRDESVESRLRQLDNTSIPLPFTCYYFAHVPDCAKLERTLHFVFGQMRARSKREFFKTDPDLVRAIIDLVKVEASAATLDGSIEASNATKAAIPEAEREEIEQIKTQKAKLRTLAALGIAPGTVLHFSKDVGITCVVHDDRKVLFRGEISSLSGAALIVLHELGFDWPTVSGMQYWTLNGVKLADRGQDADAAPEPEVSRRYLSAGWRHSRLMR